MKLKSFFPIKGLTKRWVINVLCVVAAIILLLEIIAAVLVQLYYYDTVKRSLYASLSSATGSFSRTVTTDKYADFEKQAIVFAEEFSERDRMQASVFDTSGHIIVNTSGFSASSKAAPMPDYDAALRSAKGVGEWTGSVKNGERIMAVTALCKSASGETIGALRFTVSLERVDSQVAFVIFISIAVGLSLLLFVTFTGNYFIRSIVVPIREVGTTARQIALGDFSVRIEKPNDDDEIGELCDTINYMASKLGEAENAKNDFISSVSHELRTPLTAINGWAETLNSETALDEEFTRKGMGIIIKETRRLSGLVEDLLDFSRVQNGRLAVSMEKFDIIAELSEAVLVYEEEAKKHGVQLIYSEPSDTPPVLGDRNRIRQVFVNIIDNAVKYSSAGDVVTIVAESTEKTVSVFISDTGRGISQEELPRVKEKFYKIDKTVRGSGIGLAVADEIIKMHKGTLEIRSEEGKGTIVTITLPVYVEAGLQ